MGITGLLPFVKKAQRKANIRNFSGSVAAVDGFCWLHKGSYGCAQKLGMGEPTTAYVTYFMKYVNILVTNGVRPVLVFDGRSLPSKEETNRKRREKREDNRAKAKEAIRRGDKREAWECFQKSVEITPAMVRDVIRELRVHKLDYIIAPYEADAQMAFLANAGMIDIVITEDSDLVLFGCPKIFFKMNVEGHGVFYDKSRLSLCMGQPQEKFEFERFRQMCIFSGCDYLESINGIGLGRAKKVFTTTTRDDIVLILKHAPNIVKLDIEVTDDYIAEFHRAENTFLFQLVFDPVKRQLRPLTPYTTNVDEKQLSYCGNYESPELSLGMALGNIDIQTLQKVDNFNIDDPKFGYCTTKSIWSKNYKNVARSIRMPLVASPQKTEKKESPVKSVSVPSSAILKRRITRASQIQNTPGEEEDDDSYAKLLLNSFSRSPDAKRQCRRNFYSVGKGSSSADAVSDVNGTAHQNGEKDEDEEESATEKGEQKTPSSEPSSPTNSDDSSMIRPPPADQKRLNGYAAPIGRIFPPILSKAKTTKLNVTNGKLLPKNVESSAINSEAVPVVVLSKIIDSGRPVRSCRSRFFTEGNKDFLGNKNHSLFFTKNQGKRTGF